MRKLQWVLGGSLVCVCCVLPSYEGSDTNPRGDAGSAGRGGSPSGGQAGGGKSQGGSSVVPPGGSPESVGGEGGAGATNGGVPSDGGAGEGGAPVEQGGTSNGGGGTGGTGGNGGAGNGGGGTANGGGGTGGTTTGGGGAGGSGGTSPEGPCPGNVVGHCDRNASYPTHAGYTLALVEDFPTPMDLNSDPLFTWSDAAPPDSQTSYREQQVGFSNGKLVLTAEKPSGCTASEANCLAPRNSFGEALSPNTTASISSRGVWSGELRSRYNNYRYGRYEVKMAAPIANPGQQSNDAQSGNFLAMMLAYRTPRNLQWAEVDLILQADQHAKVNTNLISASGAVGYPTGNATPATYTPAASYAIYDEHVYAFEWTPTGITWYLDGQVIRSQAGTAQVPIPTVSAKIMLSLWVFQSAIAFGDPKLNKYPFSATFDYFRFYRLNSENFYPCTPAPSCLPAADKTNSAQNNPKEMNYGQ